MSEQTYGRYSDSKKRGCPTCDGIDPRSCMRCYGKTRLCDWLNTDSGWHHRPAQHHRHRGTSMKSDYAKAKAKAIAIVEKHRRHVELSPGVGDGVQRYALMVCDDILEDLKERLDGDSE